MAANPILSVAADILAFLPPTVMTRSTCHAFLDILEHGPAPRKHQTVAADAVGSTNLVMWAVQHGMDPAVAQTSRSTEVLQWLRQVGSAWDARTCSLAAGGGHLAVLQWARAHGCSWDNKTCTEAAGNGQLEVLQWAHANGCPWGEDTCSVAARGGHLAALQWARANGCPWNADTCSSAAGGGHLHVSQWARANGCPWDADTYKGAARGGHSHVLEWARANGCPWDEGACSHAAESGPPRPAMDARKWGPLGQEDLQQRYAQGFGAEDLDKVQGIDRFPDVAADAVQQQQQRLLLRQQQQLLHWQQSL
ncbi:hypothetical protein JKP88DRAFT_281260 [Tribonema minus]|uniref:Ankyrin repeat domain-containing protein n=1 Tax=Tribonema minus TaxID=303371 RepID=A0A835YME4_9STRA|nr:hypothetical protein JKP88DRAFT_281260 [Tribonema minus]